MLSYSVGGFISVNTTLIIDAWLTSSKRLIEMQWMMKHQMTLCLIVQVAMTLLDGVQKAIPCFILLWSCKFYLIFHRVVFGLKIMRNTTPSWKSSTSIKFWQYSSGWRIRLLISRQWYSTLSYVFWKSMKIVSWLLPIPDCVPSSLSKLSIVPCTTMEFSILSGTGNPVFCCRFNVSGSQSYINSFKFITAHTQSESIHYSIHYCTLIFVRTHFIWMLRLRLPKN